MSVVSPVAEEGQAEDSRRPSEEKNQVVEHGAALSWGRVSTPDSTPLSEGRGCQEKARIVEAWSRRGQKKRRRKSSRHRGANPHETYRARKNMYKRGQAARQGARGGKRDGWNGHDASWIDIRSKRIGP